MTRRAAVVAAFLVVIAGALGAQPLPRGQWWHRPDFAQRLQLSDEQKTRLDSIFSNSASDLIDLRAAVEKASIVVHSELDQAQINRDALRKAASRLSEAQGRLFERELMMLVDMRAVLTAEQWADLRAELDRPHGRPGRSPH